MGQYRNIIIVFIAAIILLPACSIQQRVKRADKKFAIGEYFAAADIVVLPYESATQSGIVQIAYGFEKPVIATKVGGLPEVVLDGKTGYVVPPKDHHALAEAVCRFFRENKSEEFTENVRKEAYRYSWDRMNEVVQRLTEKTGAHEG